MASLRATPKTPSKVTVEHIPASEQAGGWKETCRNSQSVLGKANHCLVNFIGAALVGVMNHNDGGVVLVWTMLRMEDLTTKQSMLVFSPSSLFFFTFGSYFFVKFFLLFI